MMRLLGLGVAVIALTLALVIPAQGQVAICNPDAYGGITWQFIGCTHENHLHSQWRNGRGTRLHTVDVYKYEAAVLRNYLSRAGD